MHNKARILVFTIFISTLFSGVSLADSFSNMDKLYVKECSECHIAFPPVFHSKESWEKVMTTLDKHFGDNAELAPEDVKHILKFLQDNARHTFFWSSSDNPLRFTETRAFRSEHDEAPKKAVGPDSQVKSFSDCKACHKHADKGSYRESEISIPGFPNWED